MMSRITGLVVVVVFMAVGAMGGAILSDCDGDGIADPLVWRPNEGNWYLLPSGGGEPRPFALFWIGCVCQWGLPGDVPFTGDFSGAGVAEYGIYRPSEGSFYVLCSEGSTFRRIPVGAVGNKPVPADYDGDGRTDLATFDPKTNTWYIRQTHDLKIRTVVFRPAGGAAADAVFLAPADYDGDGKADPAFVVKARTSYNWQYRSSKTGKSAGFGVAADRNGRPVMADIDGDGRCDAVVWDAQTGYWTFFENRGVGSPLARRVQWGLPGDRPVAADFDGDGRDDFAVYRPSTGTWCILTASSPNPYAWKSGAGWALQWGLSTDEPMPRQPALLK